MARVANFVQAFQLLSAGITLAKLSVDTGGGDYFFTLVGLVLMGTVLPYLLAFAAMRRLPPRWGLAVGIAAALFGAVDVSVRMQAFFFPTDRINGGMALWLPLSALVMIPCGAVLAHVTIGALSREREGV